MIRYIFIDDAAGSREAEALGPLIDNVSHWGTELGRELIIDAVYPDQFDEQISYLRHERFDGLILDLRLDEFAPDNSQVEGGKGKANYRATGLAQEIRTRATEGNMASDEKKKVAGEFPIVLWSYSHKLQRSYTRDETGHDLFDIQCTKEELEDMGSAREVAARLIALSDGYKEILRMRRKKGGPGSQLFRFLGFAEEPEFLDRRILEYFEGRQTPLPAHVYARFIIKDLLEVPGPLVSEEILAARLGVDMIRSGEAWQEVVDCIPETAVYVGPFASGWKRWWFERVEAWWRELGESRLSLRSMEADDRLEVLEKGLGVEGLEGASPIEGSYSTKYWTVCLATKSPRDPLDPIDGVRLAMDESRAWQDDQYISELRALKDAELMPGMRLDPLERSRLEELRDELG